MQAGGTGIETLMLHSDVFVFILFFACRIAHLRAGRATLSLGWPSGPRRSTQVRVSQDAWVRIPLQAAALHFLFGGDPAASAVF